MAKFRSLLIMTANNARFLCNQQLQFVFTARLTKLINALNGRCNACSAVLCALNDKEMWENVGEASRTGR